MAICDLPDMYALGLWAYISGKSLMAMLQLLHKILYVSTLHIIHTGKWVTPIANSQNSYVNLVRRNITKHH